jgi:spore coat protein A
MGFFMTDLNSFKKELQFKTELPMPAAHSFLGEGDDCRISIEMKAGIATIFHDKDNDKKITVPIWGYALEGKSATYPGPTIEVNSRQTIEIDWKNLFEDEDRQPVMAVQVNYNKGDVIPQNILGSIAKNEYKNMKMCNDPLHNEADTCKTMGAMGCAYVATHQHGGKTASKYDGGPLGMMSVGQRQINRYENKQRATLLWYHDHAMHTTRLNVFAGLAALYVIRDEEETTLQLPSGEYEIPLVIQDRNLNDPDHKIEGLFNTKSAKSTKVDLLHAVESGEGPLEFFGPLNLVNGAIWPIKQVEDRCYRIRLLNGANSRTYRLVFAEKKSTGKKGSYSYTLCKGITVKQIGSDGGLIPSIKDDDGNPVLISLAGDSLVLAPAERADLLIDFSGVKEGSEIIILNTADAPFAGGEIDLADIVPNDPDKVSTRNPYPEVMCFKVSTVCSESPAIFDFCDLAARMEMLPSYTEEVPRLEEVGKVRTVAVVEKETPEGVVLVLWELMPSFEINTHNAILKTERKVVIDGEAYVAIAEHFQDPISFIIPEGSTERWRFINLTSDTHPMHVHLVQYLPVSRRLISKINGQFICPKEVGDILLEATAESISGGTPIVLSIEEESADLGERLDANEKCLKDTVRMNPGEMVEIVARFDEYCGSFVYHCHLLEHEDHDMMRKFIVTRNDLNTGHILPISVGL